MLLAHIRIGITEVLKVQYLDPSGSPRPLEGIHKVKRMCIITLTHFFLSTVFRFALMVQKKDGESCRHHSTNQSSTTNYPVASEFFKTTHLQ
jgi:hypothetical protein